ncbi:MAG: sugar ABC transporter substrate-binding protein [Christensenellales bacterium]|jgi:ribose transport system substrate-binding protein
MKKYFVLLICLLMLFAVTACATGSEPSAGTSSPSSSGASAPAESTASGEASGKKGYLIGYTAKSATNDPFQQFLGQAVTDYVESQGSECVWVQTDTGNADTAQQASQIENLIAMGCDGIVINPCDQSTIITSLEACKAANIPVVVVDTGAPDADRDLYITQVSTDNYVAAEKAGKAVAEALKGEGNVIIVSGLDGNQVTTHRLEGFKKGLEGTNIEVVAVQNGEYNGDKAMQVMENLLQTHADADCVYTVSDCMLDGILQAIQNNGNANPNMLIMSYDGSADATQYILDGLIFGTTAQFPVEVGRISSQALFDVLNGVKTAADFEKFIDSGSQVIDAKNAEAWLADGAY